MGTKGREIVELDVKKLLKLLNNAYADEWLAYYQYWIGAKIVKGLMKGVVIAELEEHASDELKHAQMLVERILQLNGKPLLKPQDWYANTHCGYNAPLDVSADKIVKQNIKGERCAINVYKKLADFTKDKDPITYNMILEILKDEVQHEDDLENILEDMK